MRNQQRVGTKKKLSELWANNLNGANQVCLHSKSKIQTVGLQQENIVMDTRLKIKNLTKKLKIKINTRELIWIFKLWILKPKIERHRQEERI